MRVIFLYLASVLQLSSVFTSKSVIELSTVLFIGTSWLNITMKDIHFTRKKREIMDSWQQLDDKDYKVKTHAEPQWVLINPYFNDKLSNFSTTQTKLVRYAESAYKIIRFINTAGGSILGSYSFFSIAPYFLKQLPFMLWMPFDPYESFFKFMAVYLFEVIAGFVTYMMFISLNGYIMYNGVDQFEF